MTYYTRYVVQRKLEEYLTQEVEGYEAPLPSLLVLLRSVASWAVHCQISCCADEHFENRKFLSACLRLQRLVVKRGRADH